jgi:hypothetical protein
MNKSLSETFLSGLIQPVESSSHSQIQQAELLPKSHLYISDSITQQLEKNSLISDGKSDSGNSYESFVSHLSHAKEIRSDQLRSKLKSHVSPEKITEKPPTLKTLYIKQSIIKEFAQMLNDFQEDNINIIRESAYKIKNNHK